MKMEISVCSTSPGVVKEVLCTEGGSVQAGDTLLVIKPD
jgi:biotin carboxyl carrier protein